MYIEELRNNATVNNKREQTHEALEKYKREYVTSYIFTQFLICFQIKVDTLNKLIIDGYERTRKDLNELRSAVIE